MSNSPPMPNQQYKRRKAMDSWMVDGPQHAWDCLLENFTNARQSWEGDLPPLEVDVQLDDLVDPLLQYASNAVIMFFPGRMPPAQDVAQWVVSLLKRQLVSGVFFGDRGFYEILLADADACTQLLQLSPLFYATQMVHALPWSLTKDYQSLIRHQCPVWVELLDFPRTWKHLIPKLAMSLGKVMPSTFGRQHEQILHFVGYRNGSSHGHCSQLSQMQIDIAKAFDSVHWDYIALTMKCLGFGPRLSSMVHWLYADSTTCGIIDGGLTDTWVLGRSVRQGCPLSALIYAIASHPMLLYMDHLLDTGRLHGLALPSGRQFVVQAYADDNMFLPRNEQNDVLVLMQALDTYALAAGLCIKFCKSNRLPLNHKEWHEVLWFGQIVPPIVLTRHLGYLLLGLPLIMP
ncbi:hypothetical protein L7F22_002880 [Adiantum nelumboides]|nr:hypothetical protein [Adiantum nelumboides]